MGLEDLATKLKASFPEGYWNHFHGEFTHNFFDVHLERTLEYDQTFGDLLRGRRILEIGGYPGLLVAYYRLLGCSVQTLEHPGWIRPFYQTWAADKVDRMIMADIVQGPPSEPVGDFDVAVMSDVLLHVDGFPSRFMEWLAKAAPLLIIANYPGSSSVRRVEGGSLYKWWDVPRPTELDAQMKSFGTELVSSYATKDRRISVYKRVA